MSYLFAVRRGPAPSKSIRTKLDAIAEEHGCEFVVGDMPGTGPQTWWSGPNRGAPWDARLRDDVGRACADAGLGEWCPGPRAGRPQTRSEPIDQQIVVKVTASQRADLEEIAKSDNVTLAVVARRAIDGSLLPTPILRHIAEYAVAYHKAPDGIGDPWAQFVGQNAIDDTTLVPALQRIARRLLLALCGKPA